METPGERDGGVSTTGRPLLQRVLEVLERLPDESAHLRLVERLGAVEAAAKHAARQPDVAARLAPMLADLRQAVRVEVDAALRQAPPREPDTDAPADAPAVIDEQRLAELIEQRLTRQREGAERRLEGRIAVLEQHLSGICERLDNLGADTEAAAQPVEGEGASSGELASRVEQVLEALRGGRIVGIEKKIDRLRSALDDKIGPALDERFESLRSELTDLRQGVAGGEWQETLGRIAAATESRDDERVSEALAELRRTLDEDRLGPVREQLGELAERLRQHVEAGDGGVGESQARALAGLEGSVAQIAERLAAIERAQGEAASSSGAAAEGFSRQVAEIVEGELSCRDEALSERFGSVDRAVREGLESVRADLRGVVESRPESEDAGTVVRQAVAELEQRLAADGQSHRQQVLERIEQSRAADQRTVTDAVATLTARMERIEASLNRDDPRLNGLGDELRAMRCELDASMRKLSKETVRTAELAAEAAAGVAAVGRSAASHGGLSVSASAAGAGPLRLSSGEGETGVLVERPSRVRGLLYLAATIVLIGLPITLTLRQTLNSFNEQAARQNEAVEGLQSMFPADAATGEGAAESGAGVSRGEGAEADEGEGPIAGVTVD